MANLPPDNNSENTPPPRAHDEFVLAQRSQADDEPELTLAPPAGKSSAEIQAELEAVAEARRRQLQPPEEPEEPAESPWTFTLSDLFLMSTCCAVGLAGASWVRPDVYAGLLGLTALVVIPVFYIAGARPHWIRRVWMVTLTIYLMACLAAMVRLAIAPHAGP